MLDIRDDTRAAHTIIANSIVLTFLPKAFISFTKIRFERGTAVKPADIPKEANMKNITGCEKPPNEAEKLSVIFSSGINEITIRHVTAGGKTSVINKIKKATVIPIAFTPAAVNPSGTGTKNIPIKTSIETIKPIFFLLSIIVLILFQSASYYFGKLFFLSELVSRF